MEKYTKESLQKQSAKHIADLFTNHNMDCKINENEIIFEKEQISIRVYCFDRSSVPDLKTLQLDVLINYGINAMIESFGGIGKDFATANLDAFENFMNNSFHTVLSAFFTSKFDEEVRKLQWPINNKEFEVVSSNIGVRGTMPENSTLEWLNEFETAIQKLELEEGVHWVRLYYAQDQNQTTACEVLLNNENCVSIQEKAVKFDWHKQDEFYSLRVFMILKNGVDFGRIVKIIGREQEYEDIFSSLQSIGLSELEIEKAYSFIPEAFGRKLIQDMGVSGEFSMKGVIKNDHDMQFEIDLRNEAFYSKATLLVNDLTKTGWDDEVKQIAFMSASFSGLNSAMHNGVKLEEIDCKSFSTVFLIPNYSRTNLQKQKKPFWKIW